mmetsp:Transcript_23317/g.81269  ORF Transcript_23317/g.81269 Transcript_23317/m.81269 type:complete len:214 (-) Transcript_23317:436-1077(-)
MPVCGWSHCPERASTVAPMRSMDERRSHRASTAPLAASSNWGRPVNRLSSPNSTNNDPAAAVHVRPLSRGSTPCRKLTRCTGIPVGVSKAGSRRSPRSSAMLRSSPSYSPGGITPSSASAAIKWADSRPPRTRMVVSKTLTVTFLSKRTFFTRCTAAWNSPKSPNTASASRLSTSVVEKPPRASSRSPRTRRSHLRPLHDSGFSSSHGYALSM